MATKEKVTGSAPRHFYEALGVDRGSSYEEVTAAWRRLSRELHPDRHVDNPQPYAQMFATVSQAYATLGDEKKRAAYDTLQDVASAPCPACKGQGRTWKQQGFTGKTATVCPTCGGNGRTEKKKR